MVKIYKFGGAAVKDAPAIRNVGEIVSRESQQKGLLIVVSAMGTTTNQLESLFYNAFEGRDQARLAAEWDQLFQFSLGVAKELLGDGELLNEIIQDLEDFKVHLFSIHRFEEKAKAYDQVVSYGELLSSKILVAYLKSIGVNVLWKDAREVLKTNENWREGVVDWANTEKLAKEIFVPVLDDCIIVTQGFIGQTKNKDTVTLGREGSDYSAAIFAHCLDASSLTTWKDVPGILNADPRRFATNIQFDELSYYEAAEMTYYGANVIHPKTIRPLALKGIPLIVRSFVNPNLKPTLITANRKPPIVPALIVKKDQILVTFKVKDFEYVGKDHTLSVFRTLHEVGLSPNMLKITAMSLSVAVNNDPIRTKDLLQLLREEFFVETIEGLEILTIKNYNQEYLNAFTPKTIIYLEEKTLHNYQALYKVG